MASPSGSVTFSMPVTAPVTGSGAASVVPVDCGGELTGAAAARVANPWGPVRDWPVSTVAAVVRDAVLSNCRRATAIAAHAIGDSTGAAGTGSAGPIGAAGANPT